MIQIDMLKATIFKYNIVISYFSTSRDEYFLKIVPSFEVRFMHAFDVSIQQLHQ